MRFKWNINNIVNSMMGLISLKGNVVSLFDSKKNSFYSDDLSYSILQYMEMIDLYRTFFDFEYPLEISAKIRNGLYAREKDITDFDKVDEIFKILCPAVGMVKDSCFSFEDKDFSFSFIQEANIISILRYLYSNLGDETIAKKALEFCDPASRRLMLCKDNRNSADQEYEDTSNRVFVFDDAINQQSRLCVIKTGLSDDIFTIGGSIFNLALREGSLRSNFCSRNEIFLSGVDEDFFAFYAMDMLRKQKILTDDADMYEAQLLDHVIISAFEINYSYLLLQHVPLQYINKKHVAMLKRQLRLQGEIPMADDLEWLSDNYTILDSLSSVASFLVAREIYEIYKKDRQAGLDLLKLNASLTTPLPDSLDSLGIAFHKIGFDEVGKEVKAKLQIKKHAL